MFSHCDIASVNSFPLQSDFNSKAVKYINEAIAEWHGHSLLIPNVMHWTGSVQWTWIKTAKEHYDAIAMNEYRMIHAHSAHLDLSKLKKSCTNAKNEHVNSWPFNTLGPLHRRIVQTRILSCKRWLPNVHSHLSHKDHPSCTMIMKKEAGDEDGSEEEIIPTWCTHHLPPKKHPRKSKNGREMKKNGDRKSTCD